VFPQIAKTYGDDTPLNIRVALTEAGNFQTTAANQMIGALATIDIQFWVETDLGDELALDVSMDDLQMNLTFTITDLDVALQLISFHVDSISVVESNVGRVSTVILVTTINAGLIVLVNLANKFLAQYDVQVPSEILGLFTLSDLNLEYFDGFTYFGLTPTFLPPAQGTQLFVQ
jgi:hypothetical protein